MTTKTHCTPIEGPNAGSAGGLWKAAKPRPLVDAISKAGESLANLGQAPANPCGLLPMTTGQMETLLRSELDVVSAPVFNECLSIHLPRAVDPEALDRALLRVAARHPLLRGVPDLANACWRLHGTFPKWERLEATDAESAGRMLDARASRPLGSGDAPPARFLLISLADGGTQLAFLAQHCILDGWTASVFLRELSALYRGEVGGEASALPEADDVALFLRDEVATEQSALGNSRLRDFWEKRCANLPPMNWPASFSIEGAAAGHIRIRVPDDLAERVRLAARKGGHTEFIHWLGIHLVWLHWLCRQDALAAGIPLAAQAATGRPHLLGHGTRFLPVRSERIPGMTVRGFLHALAVEVAEVMDHGQLTAGAMTPWMERDTIRAGHSLLPTAFSVVPDLADADFGPAGQGRASMHPRTHVAMPMAAWLQGQEHGLELDLVYQRALFGAPDMEIWAQTWLVIAAEMTAHPDVILEQLPLPDAPPPVAKPAASSSSSPSTRAWTPTARRIAEIWGELLGRKIDSPATDFFAAGGQSLLALRFFSRWHRETGVNAPLVNLLNFPVLADLAGQLDRLGGAPVEDGPALHPGLAMLRGGGSKAPLLFLHAGDGGVIFSRAIAGDLPTGHPVYAIESPHLTGEALPHAIDIAELAEVYLKIWDDCHVARAPVLIGYSFGGLMAWEMACRMDARGRPPAQVVLLDTHNPEVPPRALGIGQRVAKFWRQQSGLPFRARAATLVGRAIAGTKNHYRIRNEVRRAAANPPEGEFRPIRLRELHEAAMTAYRPPEYSGMVALLKAASPGDKFELPADYHWGSRARGTFTILEVPGDHLGIITPDNLPALAACLSRLLASPLPNPA